jgi:23S rRNA (cytidine1920-2'-O)/16S rRNA (cytidine1409-2'-O)-methyltransferase
MAKKNRLDFLLTERNLVESRSQAKRLIMAGQVRVDGQIIHKPATQVASTARIEIKQFPRFVSRGGKKLQAVFDHFDLDVEGKICADVGASTGGFTDCLLQHGAAKVYAIDVGKGILHWKLRNHPKVVVMEKTNARYLESLPEPVDVVTIDASFISLRLLLPVVADWFQPSPQDQPAGQVVALIKPQFEAGRREAARGRGVIRDPDIHRRVLREVLSSAQEYGYSLSGLIQSPLEGPKGNIEFLAWLSTAKLDAQASLEDLLSGLDL